MLPLLGAIFGYAIANERQNTSQDERIAMNQSQIVEIKQAISNLNGDIKKEIEKNRIENREDHKEIFKILRRIE